MVVTVKEKNVFSSILRKGAARGMYPGRTKESVTWFRNTARSFNKVDRNDLMNESSQYRKTISPGSMYMFAYEAKHKDTLPYYDKFPIIFPINLYSNGFLGINFHYLPPALRASLMDSLYEIYINKEINEKSKIKLSYAYLTGASKLKLVQPCIKRYLYSQFRSKYIYVNPENWDTALFLPTENFVGASKFQVWSDSRRVAR